MDKINRKKTLWAQVGYTLITGVIVLLFAVVLLWEDPETHNADPLFVILLILTSFFAGMGYLPFIALFKLKPLNSDELVEMGTGDALEYYYEHEDTRLYADVEVAGVFDPSRREVNVKILKILDKDLNNPEQADNVITARVGELYKNK